MALKIYDETIQMCREMALVVRQIEKRDGDLARQLRRAASSVSLNCSEGSYSLKGHERARWHTAMGSAAEVRSIVEADCVTEKKAEAAKEAEQRAAAARAAKEQALNTTPRGVSPGGSSVSHEEQRRIEQCESVKSRIESLKKQLRAGGSADTMDDLRDDESAARRQLSALCP